MSYLRTAEEREHWERLVSAEIFGHHRDAERRACELELLKGEEGLRKEASRWDLLYYLYHTAPDHLLRLWEVPTQSSEGRFEPASRFQKCGGVEMMEQKCLESLKAGCKNLPKAELFKRTRLLGEIL